MIFTKQFCLQFFSLKAIDGDTGIDKPICYGLEFEEDCKFCCLPLNS